MKILKQVTLDGVSRKKDRSVTMRFVTQLEETPEQLMEIDRLLNTSGVLYYKAEGILNEQELNELDKVSIEVTGKSKSQRLRGALMVLHQKTADVRSKEEFYSYYMEKFISHIVGQIPED
jgi:hypothetical protein